MIRGVFVGGGQSGGRGSLEDYPVLRKLNTDINPILAYADQDAPSLLWPWLVDLRLEGGEGVAMFYSTDHAGVSVAAIYLSTAPDPLGPWTHHGLIFRDPDNGQCETPSVVWDAGNARWVMYYQMQNVVGANGNQTTKWATISTILDGAGVPRTDWTIQGIAADLPAATRPGDGHTGYFRPFSYDGRWFAHSLAGGTSSSRRALWVSDGGASGPWWPDPRFIGQNAHLVQGFAGWDETWMFRFNEGPVFERGGQLWVIGDAGAPRAGGAEVAVRFCGAPLAKDGRTVGKPVDITPGLQAWEGELGATLLGNTLMWNGALYLVYRGGGKQGGFGLMEIT